MAAFRMAMADTTSEQLLGHHEQTFVCACGREFQALLSQELERTLGEGLRATDPSYIEAMLQAAGLLCAACSAKEAQR